MQVTSRLTCSVVCVRAQAQDELQEAEVIYQSINDEMRYELPQLHDSRVNFLASNFAAFFDVERKFHKESSSVRCSHCGHDAANTHCTASTIADCKRHELAVGEAAAVAPQEREWCGPWHAGKSNSLESHVSC